MSARWLLASTFLPLEKHDDSRSDLDPYRLAMLSRSHKNAVLGPGSVGIAIDP